MSPPLNAEISGVGRRRRRKLGWCQGDETTASASSGRAAGARRRLVGLTDDEGDVVNQGVLLSLISGVGDAGGDGDLLVEAHSGRSVGGSLEATVVNVAMEEPVATAGLKQELAIISHLDRENAA